MPETVSNSFDYVPARELEGFVLDPAGCTAQSLKLTKLQNSRVIIVHREERFILCRTGTTSFAEAEIRHVVHDLGQLYLDVSGKPSLDDFANDVVQLVIAPECRACPEFNGCVACYRESPRSFFQEDEVWLRRELSRLTGVVLDVGMGQVPYLDAISDRIESGAIEYHGLDPDPRVLEAAKRPELHLHPGTIEEFAPDAGAFDHIVALRSLNHFVDVDRALERICHGLAEGGSVLIVESVALPMVRSRKHSEWCHEESSGGFQHYRNWDSNLVLDRMEGQFPLDIEIHRPIGPDTCDQWILKLRRRS